MDKKVFNTSLEFEKYLIEKYLADEQNYFENYDKTSNILLICPDYNIDHMYKNIKFQQIDKNLNIDVISSKKNTFKYVNEYFNGDVFEILESINSYKLYDLIISTRLIEHFSINNLLYFVYLLNNISIDKVILTYPDMDKIIERIKNEVNNNFSGITKKLELYNIELFNEGSHIYDYHKIYLNEKIFNLIIKEENYFKNIFNINDISIGSKRDVYICSYLSKKEEL